MRNIVPLTIFSLLLLNVYAQDDIDYDKIADVYGPPPSGGAGEDLNRNPVGSSSQEPPTQGGGNAGLLEGNDGNLNLNPGGGGPTDGGIPGTGDCECVLYYLCKNNTFNTNGEGLIDIRINESGCKSYLETCCGAEDKLTEKPKRPPGPPPKPEVCGRRNPDGIGHRITGEADSEAQYAEFPWMTAILKEETMQGNTINVYQCGGALIHPQVVLTAAHCVTNKNKKFKARLGEWDTQTTNEFYPHQDISVSKIIKHPQYYAGALYNDFAVVILEEPANITENVDVLCLPEKDVKFDHSRCVATGWGKDVFGKEGKYQVILKKIDLPIVPNNECQERLRKTRLGKRFELHNSFICAGGEPGHDTCKGDGGSPLVCPIEGTSDQYFHAGIVAWGIGCGDNIPAVYASVPFVKEWVDEQIALNLPRN